MAQHAPTPLPPPSPEHRRIAAGQFERANQVIATGNFDYGINLLLSCCKLDPANLIYRQALRRTEKAKYHNNLRGHWLAWLFTWRHKARIKTALHSRNYPRVLELGERILASNPWDVGAQMDMAEAADALGLLDMAIWTLEQARQKQARDVAVNRALARLYEKRGNFTQALALWTLIRKAHPTDTEAEHKLKDLAVNETIARGNYQEVIAAAGESPETPLEGEDGRGSAAEGDTLLAPSGPDRTSREIAQLRARLKADPTNPNGYLQLAGILRRADQLDEARTVLEEGLGPTGNRFELTAELADLAIEPFRRNLILTEEKLKASPDSDDLRRLRIRLRKEINARELELFRQKADRYPTEMANRFEMGVRLLRAGQIDEAIRELQASRADPRHRWRSLLYLGHCFKERNNWRLAQRNFEEALKEMPPNEEAARKEVLFLLAQGHADAGDLARAVDVGHELANLDFAFRDIGRLLDEWQTRLQQADVSR
jgi:tetratricopeptide (TPR) repeat protein